MEWSRHYRRQRKIWREATSVEELAERGARWCAGELGAHPYGYDVPDAETCQLLPVLAHANRAGFFTFQSQPGGIWEAPGEHIEQRAFVSGYLSRVDMLSFREHLEGAGMLVLDSLVHDEPLTKVNGEVVTGGNWKPRVEDDFQHISAAAHRDLSKAASLEVIDLVWGRGDALWNALERWAATRA